MNQGGRLRLPFFLVHWYSLEYMDEIFRIESTGRGGKRRWNVWKYRVVSKGVEERMSMRSQNHTPFHSFDEALAFRKQIAPNQPD
jgi:hypothetical protein